MGIAGLQLITLSRSLFRDALIH